MDNEQMLIEHETIVNQFLTASSKLERYTQEYQEAWMSNSKEVKPEEFCEQIVECMGIINDTLYNFSKHHKIQI